MKSECADPQCNGLNRQNPQPYDATKLSPYVQGRLKKEGITDKWLTQCQYCDSIWAIKSDLTSETHLLINEKIKTDAEKLIIGRKNIR